MSEDEQGGTPEESAATPETANTPETPEPQAEAEATGSVNADGAPTGDDPVLEQDPSAALEAAQAAVADALDGDLESADAGEMDAVQESADDIDAVMTQADRQAGAQPTGFAMPSFSPAGPGTDSAEMQLLGDVNVDVRIELGRTRMLVEDVLRLGEGAVVELEKLAGDPVDVYVNGRHVAKGEVLVLNESFCVRVNEVLEPVTIEAAEDS